MGCACSAKPSDYLTCARIRTPRADTPQLEAYADRVGTNASSRCYVIACLVANQIIYWQNNPGDCGTNPTVNLAALKGTGIAGTIAGSVGGIGEATGAIAAGSIAATGLAVATAGIALLALPLEIFAHHAAAVANEHKILCQVSGVWNQFEAQIEQALQAGQYTLAQAKQMANSALSECVQAAQQIAKPCNFACGMIYALKACTLYNIENLYPALVPQIATTGAQAPMGIAGAQAPASSTSKSNSAVLWAALGAVALKVTGVL